MSKQKAIETMQPYFAGALLHLVRGDARMKELDIVEAIPGNASPTGFEVIFKNGLRLTVRVEVSELQPPPAAVLGEEHAQLVLLALAQLSLERPGWESILSEVAGFFPRGVEVFDEFRRANSDTRPVANVAEACAKIVETYLPLRAGESSVKNAIAEIRRYAQDLRRLENMGANRG